MKDFSVCRWAFSAFCGIIIIIALALSIAAAPARAESRLDAYLGLPLVNRDAAKGPGGVNPRLPDDLATLQHLIDQARSGGVAPSRYAALLYQYWLVKATTAAGIDLSAWNPRSGVTANRQNLIKSYRYYENFQLSHRELQWAGMGGQVGADFGGGLIDFELMAGVYDFPAIQQTSRAVVKAVTDVAGPQALTLLPEGLRALANAGSTITGADLQYILGMILVMQKNIFSDLMPMHQAYATRGLPALEEMQRAGLFGETIMNAWRDVASKTSDRIAAGNGVLLRREQGQIIKAQWDLVRSYRGDVGEAITYLSTLAGSPSVAGVTPPRSFKPVNTTTTLPDGRTVTLVSPLPSWNWAVFEERWDYIDTQLLPKYKIMVNNNWPALKAQLQVPYVQQLESHRPTMTIPQTLQSMLANTKVSVS
ncbi:hypothetical protein [Gordonia sp. CPCC 205333]|uniref:hypothetical protein n=1 Tax=Gordonia sp. CPCC 205333 TaxID=3140790 RepID=UPI003AF3B3A7